MSSIDPILSVVSTWATERDDIVAVALIGSHARGSPSVDSDIDLVVLTPNPNSFRKSAWLAQIRWASFGRTVATYRDAVYGAVWSRHVTLDDNARVEFSFGAPTWAATSPCDPGTEGVVRAGCRVLYDPQGLLRALVRHAA